MKATNVEIEEAKDFLLNVAISDARVYSSIVILCEAADETLKYRDALRFRSFDELPEVGAGALEYIELSRVGTMPYSAMWNGTKCRVEGGSNNGYTAQELTFMDYTGWRYRVGDLVGGKE